LIRVSTRKENVQEENMAKPQGKHDMWCYTATKRSARKKVKRASSKARRRAERRREE